MDTLTNVVPKDAQTVLIFFVNGKKVVEENPDPEWTLLWYLRKKLQLTGTKYGCGEGGCGACTVMISHYLRIEDRIKHYAVNACLTPLCSLHGRAVTTVEGIGSVQDKLHPVQERIAKAHGSQCGFCTPGIVMSMYALLRDKAKINYDDIETALQGNLCRCTGYRPIIEGFKTFIEGWEVQYANDDTAKGMCSLGKDCCKNKKPLETQLFNKSTFKPYDPTQEPIFPPELKLNSEFDSAYLMFKGERVVWLQPRNIDELLILKHHFPKSKIVVGNTEIGVETKVKQNVYPVLLSTANVPYMNFCREHDSFVEIGAATTLTDLFHFLEKQIKVNSHRTKIYSALKDMLHWFAGNQVRNVASLAGNIVTASPISDLNPILMACSATVNVINLERGKKKVLIDESFFKSYRKTILEDDEVVMSIEISYTNDFQYFKAYKQARRRDDDISIVTAAFNVQLKPNSTKVVEANLCFGGMGPTTICAKKTSDMLIGKEINRDLTQQVFDSLTNELKLDSSAPGGMAEYRKSLCLSLFFRFYLYLGQEIGNLFEIDIKIPKKHLSAIDEIKVSQPNSSQYFEIRDDYLKPYDSIGKPIAHVSASKQATGEALYCDDIPATDSELYLTLVFAEESHAEIKSIDASEALKIKGVKAFLSAADLEMECNKMGCIFKDEEIFSEKVVTSRACVIGALVAESESIARQAKKFIRVIYEKLQPVIVTIEDAILHQSYFSSSPETLIKGNVSEAFNRSSRSAEGCMRSGAQEHFYLETMSAFAVRREDELEITTTTQNPAEVVATASRALQIPQHKVVCKVKRVGGGFGGKETRSMFLALPVAIAAYKLKKPVRSVLQRDEDMQVTGYRHPFLIKYKVAFNEDGKINGAIFNVYINAGNYMDISCAMLSRAIMHLDNCYDIPNIEVNGYICKTNMPSNTAFRGFGAPKSMLATEIMIRDIAMLLGKSYEEIALKNMYHEGSLTHYNQILTYCTLKQCWEECVANSNYMQRKKEVLEFNRSNRFKKRGIALVPTKYGISFQMDILMQGGALIHVYTDGSVLLSIGGIEMGQGLFTKMIQVASRALEIDVNKIHISEMATNKVPNSSPTAASVSSDLYGMAVIDACNVLNERLKPIKAKNPGGKWEDWILDANENRVSLSATGFYAAPKIEYEKKNNAGKLYEYFTYGVACSEVIIDCLTGNHQVLRTDIVMDLGESLNPAIDIGQIEGAFMQGYGFYVMEEMVFAPTGEVLSKGPGSYKIPGFSDIPREFNVSLLKGAPNPRAVYSSKAVGEPPLFLAASVYFAIKEAIQSARAESGASADFTLQVPATCARIRMACEDEITRQVKPSIMDTGRWNVVA